MLWVLSNPRSSRSGWVFTSCGVQFSLGLQLRLGSHPALDRPRHRLPQITPSFVVAQTRNTQLRDTFWIFLGCTPSPSLQI